MGLPVLPAVLAVLPVLPVPAMWPGWAGLTARGLGGEGRGTPVRSRGQGSTALRLRRPRRSAGGEVGLEAGRDALRALRAPRALRVRRPLGSLHPLRSVSGRSRPVVRHGTTLGLFMWQISPMTR